MSLVARGAGRPFASFFVLPFEYNTTDAGLAHGFLTAVATGAYGGNVLASPAASGTWRIATDGGDASIWMNMHQTQETAACLHRVFKGSPCNQPGTRPEIFILPTSVHTYSCYGGVDTNSLALLGSFTAVARDRAKAPDILGISNQVRFAVGVRWAPLGWGCRSPRMPPRGDLRPDIAPCSLALLIRGLTASMQYTPARSDLCLGQPWSGDLACFCLGPSWIAPECIPRLRA